VTIENFQT